MVESMEGVGATIRQSERLWPAENLEAVLRCPVCAEAERKILHPELRDNAFRAAAGKWSLWSCVACGCAYLDPRPSQDSIHLAYANYYTHKPLSVKCEYSDLSVFRKFRRRLLNGYVNWRYSSRSSPSSVLGVPAAFLIPKFRRAIAREYRHLPRLPKCGGALLDVGCGDGGFLNIARSCGWDAVGLDPDPKVVANAANYGFSVNLGGIEFYNGKSELFDVITVAHVVEHVYDPVELLSSCYRLLKKGGQLWIETPNIDSFGHAYFKGDWRGLEAPRHLVLFNRQSLRRALLDTGFQILRDRATPSSCQSMYRASYAMARGLMPDEEILLPSSVLFRALVAGVVGRLLPSRREFLTMTACKDRQ